MTRRVLIVAGSDSGGGAGIQADVKAVTMLGAYAATAITAVTAQNTLGVFASVPLDPDFVARQMEVVLTDIGADAIKTGMLGSARTVERVAETCRTFAPGVPIVVDPVLFSKGGTPLFDPGAREVLVRELVPMAAVLTPNVPEAELLSGVRIDNETDLERAADRLLLLGASAVLLKGGHLAGATVVDLLRTADGGRHRFTSPRLMTRSTHGTGCTLASAIAAAIADGFTLEAGVERARDYVLEAIRSAPNLGQGHGPLNHAHPLSRRDAEEAIENETIH